MQIPKKSRLAHFFISHPTYSKPIHTFSKALLPAHHCPPSSPFPCPACPVECVAYSSGACPVKSLPRLPCSSRRWYWGGTSPLFHWGESHFTGVAPVDGTAGAQLGSALTPQSFALHGSYSGTNSFSFCLIPGASCSSASFSNSSSPCLNQCLKAS